MPPVTSTIVNVFDEYVKAEIPEPCPLPAVVKILQFELLVPPLIPSIVEPVQELIKF